MLCPPEREGIVSTFVCLCQILIHPRLKTEEEIHVSMLLLQFLRLGQLQSHTLYASIVYITLSQPSSCSFQHSLYKDCNITLSKYEYIHGGLQELSYLCFTHHEHWLVFRWEFWPCKKADQRKCWGEREIKWKRVWWGFWYWVARAYMWKELAGIFLQCGFIWKDKFAATVAAAAAAMWNSLDSWDAVALPSSRWCSCR